MSAPTRAGSQRLRVCFASAQTAVLRCKTRRHWLCRWRSHTALDVAAASRGFSRPHRFTQSQLLGSFALNFRSARVNHLSIVGLAARRQGYYGSWLPFLLDAARSAKAWFLMLHAGATSRQEPTAASVPKREQIHRRFMANSVAECPQPRGNAAWAI